MATNTLIEHVRALNMREQREHDERREKAIKRIKELRQRIRLEQENSARKDTIGDIS